MQLIRKGPLGLLLFLVVAGSACASSRGVRVGTDVTYPVEVVNQLSQTVTVYWSDGRDPRALGSVAAGRTERFIVVGSNGTEITITARDADGTQRAGPISVSLEAGVTRRVVVR